MHWVEEQPNGRVKVTLASIVAEHIDDPAAAAAWLGRLEPELTLNLSDVVSRTGSRWVKKDPAAALAWLSGIQEESLRDSGAVDVFQIWGRDEPSEASRFLADLETGHALREVAVEGFVRSLVVSDPEAAVTWADTMDPDYRESSGLNGVLKATIAPEEGSEETPTPEAIF